MRHEGETAASTESPPCKALSGRASSFALFGGQGINEIYFDELQMLFDTYYPFVEPFLISIDDGVLQPLASVSQSTSFYEYGLNGISWLTGVAPLPPIAYFASVPVSSPPIRLTQFIQYYAAARVSGLSPAELWAHFSGTSGHSQGLVTAVAIFSSKDYVSFLENVQKALKWLFFAGLRGQQLFLVLRSIHP